MDQHERQAVNILRELSNGSSLMAAYVFLRTAEQKLVLGLDCSNVLRINNCCFFLSCIEVMLYGQF